MLLVHSSFPLLNLIVTLKLDKKVCDLEQGITSHNFNIFIYEGDQSSSVSCDLSTVMDLLQSTSSHPPPIHDPDLVTIHILPQSISFLALSVVIHLWPQSVSGHDSSQAVIYLVITYHSFSICFHLVSNCA